MVLFEPNDRMLDMIKQKSAKTRNILKTMRLLRISELHKPLNFILLNGATGVFDVDKAWIIRYTFKIFSDNSSLLY